MFMLFAVFEVEALVAVLADTAVDPCPYAILLVVLCSSCWFLPLQTLAMLLT